MIKTVSKISLMLLLLCPVTVLAAEGSVTYTDGKVNYYPLKPDFVANLSGGGKRIHFMKVTVQVMTRDTAVIRAIEENNPAVRHALLMLLSNQTYDAMRDVQKREQVRLEAMEQLKNILAELAGISDEKKIEDAEGKKHPSGIQAIYFTDFVIQ